MKFGLKHFKKYLKDRGITIENCEATRQDVPAMGGGSGFWEFTIDGIEVDVGYTVYYCCETLFNTPSKPMPYKLFKHFDKYIELCDETKGDTYNYGFTDSKGNYIIEAKVNRETGSYIIEKEVKK